MHQVPIVDADVRHDDECVGERHMLTLRDNLSVPSMDHNLIPPFLTRKVEINVRTTTNFQIEDSSIDDHSEYFPKESLRTRLKLNDMFSYFPSTKLSVCMLNESDQELLLKPDGPLNLHKIDCSEMQDRMLDLEGNLVK